MLLCEVILDINNLVKRSIFFLTDDEFLVTGKLGFSIVLNLYRIRSILPGIREILFFDKKHGSPQI